MTTATTEARPSLSPTANLPQPVPIQDAFRALGVSRTSGFLAVQEGRFPLKTFRIGGRIFVARPALERLLLGIDADPGDRLTA